MCIYTKKINALTGQEAAQLVKSYLLIESDHPILAHIDERIEAGSPCFECEEACEALKDRLVEQGVLTSLHIACWQMQARHELEADDSLEQLFQSSGEQWKGSDVFWEEYTDIDSMEELNKLIEEFKRKKGNSS